MRMNRYLAIDPGVTTGYTLAYHEDNHLYLCSFQRRHTVREVHDLLTELSPGRVICEDFEFRQAARDNLELFSVQVIGIVSLYAQSLINVTQSAFDVTLKMQKASQGKSYYSDDRLKALGIYLKGVPHGMDSLRHMMHWLVFGQGFKYNNDPMLQQVELTWLTQGYFDLSNFKE